MTVPKITKKECIQNLKVGQEAAATEAAANEAASEQAAVEQAAAQEALAPPVATFRRFTPAREQREWQNQLCVGGMRNPHVAVAQNTGRQRVGRIVRGVFTGLAGARARGIASAIWVVGCRHDARVSAGRSRVANIGCISGRGARATRAAVWEQRRRCAPAVRRASPTKPSRSGDGACGAAAARVWSAWRRRGARARVARRHVGKAQDQRPQWKRPRPDICTPGDLHPH